MTCEFQPIRIHDSTIANLQHQVDILNEGRAEHETLLSVEDIVEAACFDWLATRRKQIDWSAK